MPRPSMKDVARLAGVSTATVSFVISGKPGVAKDTEARVVDAIETLGYQKNRAASALRRGASEKIWVIVPDVTNPFYAELVAGMEEAATELDLEISFANANLDPDREFHYLTQALRSDSVGVLYVPLTRGQLQRPEVSSLRGSGPPVILVDEEVSQDVPVVVTIDNHLGGRLVAEHFHETGRTRSGVIGAPRGMPTSTGRVSSFVDCGRELGLEIPDGAVGAATTRVGDASAQAIEMLLRDRTIDSFFAGDDLLAIRLIHDLQTHGVRVPEDIAVCGFDDIFWGELVTPSLTTVHQPAREMGRRAALLTPNARDSDPIRLQLPTRLVVRESTVAQRL